MEVGVIEKFTERYKMSCTGMVLFVSFSRDFVDLNVRNMHSNIEKLPRINMSLCIFTLVKVKFNKRKFIKK
jgi:hypothetical protein